jgi:hypothetical protein
MSLFEKLKQVKSEGDVKATYIKVLGHTVREELKLNRQDIGWYQLRKAMEKRNESGDFPPVSFDNFKEAYATLTEKLQPMVYELGFLKG